MTDYSKHVLMNRTKPKIIQLYVEQQDKLMTELKDKDDYIHKLELELLKINKEHNIHTVLQDEMATVGIDLNKPPEHMPIILDTGNNSEEHYNQKLYETVNNENDKLRKTINHKNQLIFKYSIMDEDGIENGSRYNKWCETLGIKYNAETDTPPTVNDMLNKLKLDQKKYSINQPLDNTYQTWGDLLEIEGWDFDIEDVYNEVEKLVQFKLDNGTDNTNFERLVKKCHTFKNKILELEFKNLKIKEYEERYFKEKEWRENAKLREHEQRKKADDLDFKNMVLKKDNIRLKKVVDKLMD